MNARCTSWIPSMGKSTSTAAQRGRWFRVRRNSLGSSRPTGTSSSAVAQRSAPQSKKTPPAKPGTPTTITAKTAVRKACANLRTRYGNADNNPDNNPGMAALAGACRALEEIITRVGKAKNSDIDIQGVKRVLYHLISPICRVLKQPQKEKLNVKPA